MADLEITFGKRKRLRVPLALFLMAVFYFVFAISDMQSSVQTGNRGQDRTQAHIALLLFTGYMGVYAIFNVRKIKLTRTLSPLILLAIWIFINAVINGAETWDMLVQMNMSVLWVLSYLFFYDYTRRGDREKKYTFQFSAVVLLFYCCATAYYSANALQNYGYFTAMNIIYYALAVFPWILINESCNKLFYISSFLATFISLKRGAIIALPIMYIIYIVLNEQNRKHTARKLLLIIGFFTILIIAFCIVDGYTNGLMTQRFSAEELATGSGRTDFYKIALNEIANRNLIRFLIGSGIGSSVDLLGTGVHNEYLEMLFSFGVIGLLLYASFIFGIITQTIKLYKISTKLGSIAAMSTALYLILSFVSTGYGGYYGVFLFGFWGYIESLAEKAVNAYAQ